jgi:FPC/CPF motif-containing protein YcgG
MSQSTESDQSTALITQGQLGADQQEWHRVAVKEIETCLADPGFPCVFSRNALRKQLLRFIFVDNSEPSEIRHLAAGLAEYVEISNRWDGQLDTAYPLVVVFSPTAVSAKTVDDYHAFGWWVLQRLHEIDPVPWPDGVSKDPESDSWSMCFNGMPLFCNMSSPAHEVRRSRNLGVYFVLVVNPRDRFDIFAGDTPSGRKVRANIRGRIGRYDGSPHARQLGSYGVAGLEWWQYGLIEQNAERSDKCPFTFRNG